MEPVEPRPGNVTLKPANPALFVEWTAVYDRVVARREPPSRCSGSPPVWRGGTCEDAASPDRLGWCAHSRPCQLALAQT
jgi:hypothetical protein